MGMVKEGMRPGWFNFSLYVLLLMGYGVLMRFCTDEQPYQVLLMCKNGCDRHLNRENGIEGKYGGKKQ